MEAEAARKKVPLSGNTATGVLKIIALCLMVVDHMGKMLFPQLLEMRAVGRVAFPLYAWCMVVGFHYTHSPLKYALRILLVGLLSQPLYCVALNHTWSEPNIFLTLFLALIGLMALAEKPFELRSGAWRLFGRTLAVLGMGCVLFLADALGCDYGWRGVLLVALLYGAREKKSALAAVMIAFCLFWGTTSSSVGALFGISFQLMGTASALLSPWLRLQALAIFALPLMLCSWKRDFQMPLWLSYAVYPAHLAVLWALEQVM